MEKDGFQILRCRACALVFLGHDTDLNSLKKFYSKDYFQAGPDHRGYENYKDCEKFLTTNYKRRIRHLNRFVQGGNVLDVGCGYGFFLACLDHSFAGVGLDISEHAIEIARTTYGIDARTGPLTSSMFPADHFSLITMWDVIEHLSDPTVTLEIIHTILKNDGILALTTGNVDSMTARLTGRRWHLYTVPDHLSFFSRNTLRHLLEQTGFRVIEMRSEWSYYSIDYLIERISKTLFRSRIITRNVPLKPMLARVIIPFTLFDVMYVVCQKR
jgi:2-polyprenyl-3-methyl-5-hydroxy-6-metoxy-1,4-benzoquinol methylase